MRIVICLICTVCITLNAWAQRVCITATVAKNNSITGGAINNREMGRDTIRDEIITIPVIIHVLYHTAEENISEAQIKSQLEVLNRDFRRMNLDAFNTPEVFRTDAADSRIMFCLAQVTPQGRPTKGIVRKYTSKEFFLGDDAMKFSAAGGDDAWDTRKYLNIWICSLFGRSLGYATMPGGTADRDGVVIKYDVFGTTGILRPPFHKGRTATHEIAHWMGLKHIWGDDICGSDDVDDTPKQTSYNFGCPGFPHKSSCSVNLNGDMFNNFMDLTDDLCMNFFTHGQKIKMRSIFSVGASRNTMLMSYACDSSLASGAPLPGDISEPDKLMYSIQVYPNPVQQKISVKSINDYVLTGKPLVIFNSVGVPVYRSTLLSGNTVNLDLEILHLKSGVYFLQVGIGAELCRASFIKL